MFHVKHPKQSGHPSRLCPRSLSTMFHVKHRPCPSECPRTAHGQRPPYAFLARAPMMCRTSPDPRAPTGTSIAASRGVPPRTPSPPAPHHCRTAARVPPASRMCPGRRASVPCESSLLSATWTASASTEPTGPVPIRHGPPRSAHLHVPGTTHPTGVRSAHRPVPPHWESELPVLARVHCVALSCARFPLTAWMAWTACDHRVTRQTRPHAAPRCRYPPGVRRRRSLRMSAFGIVPLPRSAAAYQSLGHPPSSSRAVRRCFT